jgi:hypothetical protein
LGFLLAIQAMGMPGLMWPMGQGGFQSLLDIPPAYALHGRPAHIQRFHNGLIMPAGSSFSLVGFQQNSRMREFPRRCLADADQVGQRRSLRLGQSGDPSLVHTPILAIRPSQAHIYGRRLYTKHVTNLVT